MITLTDNAKEQMNSVCRDGQYVRLSIQGGGCSGFQYHWEVTDTLEDDDNQFAITDDKVFVIDPVSMVYLEGSEIDYIKDGFSQLFAINNPNTVGSCGCGVSITF